VIRARPRPDPIVHAIGEGLERTGGTMDGLRLRGAAAILVTCMLGVWVTRAAGQQGAPAAAADLTGEWRLDPSRSDAPPTGGGGHGGGYGGHGHGGGGWSGGESGGHGGGGWGGHGGGGANGASADGSGSRGGRGARLPSLFHITQTPTLVSFEDSTGVVLQEIATVAAAADTMTRAPGALHIPGTWSGATLTVSHEGANGKVHETWTLEKSGTTLDQVVAFESQMGSRTMKRVYVRVEEP
jgi:hypothetical protein